MARFTILVLLAINLAISAAATAAPQQQRRLFGNRRLLDDLPLVPTVDGTNVQRTNQIVSYGDALGSVLQNEAQAQAAAGNPISVTSAVADTIKAGQVDSDTRRHVVGGDASAAIARAAGSGDPASAASATREAAGLAGYTVYGQGLQLSDGDRSNLANLEGQRAVQLGLDSGDAFLSTERAAQSTEAATRATASHEWTN